MQILVPPHFNCSGDSTVRIWNERSEVPITGQLVDYIAAKGLPQLRHFFERRCIARGNDVEIMHAQPTCYTLRQLYAGREATKSDAKQLKFVSTVANFACGCLTSLRPIWSKERKRPLAKVGKLCFALLRVQCKHALTFKLVSQH